MAKRSRIERPDVKFAEANPRIISTAVDERHTRDERGLPPSAGALLGALIPQSLARGSPFLPDELALEGAACHGLHTSHSPPHAPSHGLSCRPVQVADPCFLLRAVYEATARLPPMANDFAQVEAPTRQFEQALLQVRHFTETLVLIAPYDAGVIALGRAILQRIQREGCGLKVRHKTGDSLGETVHYRL